MRELKVFLKSQTLIREFLVIVWLLSSFPYGTSVSAARPNTNIGGLVGHAQSYGLSCESRSAADVAAFWQVSLSEADILNAMPRSDDPEIGFVGDVNGAWGYVPPHAYGVHAQPIAIVLQQNGLDAIPRQAIPFEELQAEIDAGHPVIVWVIGAVWNGTPQVYTTNAGKQVIVAAFEHTMIMTGYDDNNVTLVNAGDGRTAEYSRAAFLTSWQVLNNLAVVVKGRLDVHPATPGAVPTEVLPAPSQTVVTPEATSTPQTTPSPEVPPATPPAAETPTAENPPAVEGTAQPLEPVEEVSYTVQPGDSLTAIADHFEISWQVLADYNHLPSPYVVYSGQVLKIPRYANTPDASSPATGLPAPVLSEYVVQTGDTLASLARRLRVKWQELAAWNRLTYPYRLSPGQIIRIPQAVENVIQ